MRILISPAKRMNVDADSLPPQGLPRFLPEALRLTETLRSMDYAGLKALWNCSDGIAQNNFRRLQGADLRQGATPAIFSYEGIQYQYMAPGVFEENQLRYIQERLRILSGLYGLLRPFDGVVPYRLEMQARLRVDGCRDLYAYWGDKLVRQLCSETDLIVNLASKEYSRAVSPRLPRGVRFLTCTFGELRGRKIVEKATFCKMARGEMVRFLAEERITDPADIRAFRRLGYAYSDALSGRDHFVFIKEATRHAE